MFRRNGDGTFYVAVKIGGDSKQMMGLAAISFDKAFSFGFTASVAFGPPTILSERELKSPTAAVGSLHMESMLIRTTVNPHHCKSAPL
jgi:hypothetical protein